MLLDLQKSVTRKIEIKKVSQDEPSNSPSVSKLLQGMRAVLLRAFENWW